MADRTVLITGCSSGIGRATAEVFRAEDWTVYAMARDEADIEELAEAGCKTQELDVTEQAQIETVVERMHEEEGRIDCLVNNAGYGQFGPVEDVPTDRVHAQFDVNVYGPHRLARAVLPHMRGRGDGTIVNISSVAGRVATPGMGIYSGSKFALEGMSDAMRAELDEYGVDVVLVEPGPVETDFRERATEDLKDDLDPSGAYETVYRFYEDQQASGAASAVSVPPSAVARVILEAASSTNPDPRYPVGKFARLSLRARFVPDRLRDAAYGLVRKVV